MKLLYAGAGVSEKPFSQLLYNCTRNKQCQREYFVPFKQYPDIFFFVSLPGKPSLIETTVLNVCDIDNPGSAVWNKYVVGQDASGNWYGVFSNPTVTPPDDVIFKCIFFKLSFTISGVVHVYYSQQMCFPDCGTLLSLKACYPDIPEGANGSDCNGVYYGFPNNLDVLGNASFRYYHWAYVRQGNVIEAKNKFTFNAFNSKKTYKSIFSREYLLEFELVPTFQKDVLIGIFNRGNITAEGTEYKLAESQEVSMIDTDSRLWKMDMTLDSECKQTFGCSQTTCECIGTSFTGSLPDGALGIPYSFDLALTGTAPFTLLTIVKPDWMTITVEGNVIHFTGTPDEAGDDIEVSFDIENCDGIEPFDQTIDITEECVPAAIVPSDLPDATGGSPYNAIVNLTGTAPFSIGSIVKPSWMTISIVGSQVIFGGTPPDAAEDDSEVSFTIDNCGEDPQNFSQTIDVSASCMMYDIQPDPGGVCLEWDDCSSGTLMNNCYTTPLNICAKTGTMSIVTGGATIAEIPGGLGCP
jgi:hypothetical protein